jgi:hypothetical protein
MEALVSRPDLVAKTERMSAATLAEQLSGSKPPTVLDVRTEKERHDRSISGSVHISLPNLVERHQELKGREPVVVHCASGYRSDRRQLVGTPGTAPRDRLGGRDRRLGRVRGDRLEGIRMNRIR